MSRKDKKKDKRRPIVGGVFFLGLGILMLFAEYGSLEQTWPVLVILVGVALIIGAMFKKSQVVDDNPPPPPPPEVPQHR